MSCSVMIKAEDGEERRVCVDSEELKIMTVKEFRRRFCPDDGYGHYELVYENKRLEDHQTLHSCGVRNGVIIHQKREKCVVYPQGPKKEINDSPLPRSMSMEKLVPMRKFEIKYVTVRMPEKPQSP
ncbi:hypothetical protein ABG768_017710 [Culter alburnus]|uniref:Ubiquitin-like domain-containing protein n=1 Tax=Culter alburnus TaxID=194366 RepID=A0AAW1YV17_CULAL